MTFQLFIQLNCTFDETGAIKTSGIYGSALVCVPAFEVHRYVSNANYTVNLMHSITEVYSFEILNGLSNGMEFLNFINEALQLQREDGNEVLERADCVMRDRSQSIC